MRESYPLQERYVPTTESSFYNWTDDEGFNYIKVSMGQGTGGKDWVITVNGQEGTEIQKWYGDYTEARIALADLCLEEDLSIEHIQSVLDT